MLPTLTDPPSLTQTHRMSLCEIVVRTRKSACQHQAWLINVCGIGTAEFSSSHKKFLFYSAEKPAYSNFHPHPCSYLTFFTSSCYSSAISSFFQPVCCNLEQSSERDRVITKKNATIHGASSILLPPLLASHLVLPFPAMFQLSINAHYCALEVSERKVTLLHFPPFFFFFCFYQV